MITSKSLLLAMEHHNNKISCEHEEASDPPIAHDAEGKEASEQEAWESPTQQLEIMQGEEGGRGVATRGPSRLQAMTSRRARRHRARR
jgi:hypothetical protein